NYLAATNGWPIGTACLKCQYSLFQQVRAAGLSWKTYAEGMVANCSFDRVPGTFYAPGHNAPIWYYMMATDCAVGDVPLQQVEPDGTVVKNLANDLNANDLPNYVQIVPSNCHAMHEVCYDGLPGGDSFLQ